MYAIEKNVPIPEDCLPQPKYPFARMDIGDSFLVPAYNGNRKVVQRRVAVMATHENKKNGKRYTVRMAQRGVRCWRIK